MIQNAATGLTVLALSLWLWTGVQPTQTLTLSGVARVQEGVNAHVPSFAVHASDRRSYVLAGDIGVNVRAALDANGGRLRSFVIAPGETWSFGRTIAPISAMGNLTYVGGVYAGGWCDLSAMVLRVALQLGLRADYPQHAGVSEPFPGIWLDENGDGADLRITNTLPRPVVFRADEQGGELIVTGGLL